MKPQLIQFIFLAIYLQLCFLPLTQAQIIGKLTDKNGLPISDASIVLHNAKDSAALNLVASQLDGTFTIPAVIGTYYCSMSMLGYASKNTPTFTVLDIHSLINLGNFTLINDADLGLFEVVGEKLLYQQEIDRMVFNVDKIITGAGATALDLLQRSPGVMVNRQSNSISMAGKDGVLLMINGKMNRMPKEAVVQMLAGMPSSNIKKIELITTPPANFDAEGNAGFINIVLKKSNDMGLNGSYTLSGGFGRGNLFSGATNFNYRASNYNIYGDYSYSRRDQETSSNFVQELLIDGQKIGTINHGIRFPSVQRNHTARLGIDWELGKKTVLGALVTGYDNRYSQVGKTNASFFRNDILDTLMNMKVNEYNSWKNLAGNLNLTHNFREGESISFDADYLYYFNDQPVNYNLDFLDGVNRFLYNKETFSCKKTKINVAVSSLNYAKELSKNIKMDLGLKGTLSNFDNYVTVAKIDNGTYIYDPFFTAKYRLVESIGAAFTSFDIKVNEKTDLKVGLRYEYTNSNLGSEEQANIVDRHYGRFFPSFFLSRTINENQSANLSYVRRITRPTFNDLAPFVFFVDPFTFLSGNAALQPAFSNNLKIDYRIKSTLLSLQYSKEDSTISNFQPKVIEGTRKVIYAAQNMKNRHTFALTLAFPVQIAKWWKMQNNVVGTWQEANAYLGKQLIHLQTKNLQLVWINSFTLPKDFSAEILSTYQTKALSGASITLPVNMVNIGIQKKLKNNQGTFRFGIDDVFNSLLFRFNNQLSNDALNSKIILDFSQRTFKLSYNRNFGSQTVRSNRERTLGSQDERERVNN